MKENKVHQILPLASIEEPANPIRSGVNETKFEELKQSISEVGLVQPIIVKKTGKRYEVIAGHRRYLAMKELGEEKIATLIVPADANLEDAFKIHENEFREEMSALDEANYYSELMERNKWSVRDLAKHLKKSESSISQKVGALGWDPRILKAMDEGKINWSVARELSRFNDEYGRKTHLEYAINSGANQRQVATWATQYNQLQNEEAATTEQMPEPTGTHEQRPAERVYCHFCQEYHDWRETKLMRMCTDCQSKTGF